MKIFLFLICAFFISSCGKNYSNFIESNIAEIREFIMTGKNQEVSANLMCGMRECDYILNGIATSLIEFGVITFEIENIDNYDTTNATYILNVNSDRYTGVLEKNPFDNTLVADIKKIIDSNANVSAKIVIGDFSRIIELETINVDWKISSDNIIDILIKEHKDKLDTFISNKEFLAEVYIKIINDSDIYKDSYYWYVNILGKEGNSYNLIISPYTGQVLASNYKIL